MFVFAMVHLYQGLNKFFFLVLSASDLLNNHIPETVWKNLTSPLRRVKRFLSKTNNCHTQTCNCVDAVFVLCTSWEVKPSTTSWKENQSHSSQGSSIYRGVYYPSHTFSIWKRFLNINEKIVFFCPVHWLVLEKAICPFSI